MSAIATDHDLAALAGAIARGEASARDAVARALARARAWQPSINAFVAIDDEGAMRRAAEADRLRASGAALPPLHGVPVALKDMFDRDGRAPGCGAGPGRAAPGLRDAAVVEALARSGAIVVGVLNMTEFALGLTGHNDHVGECRNPLARDRLTGGSSSGTAAAVAARIVPASIASSSIACLLYTSPSPRD